MKGTEKFFYFFFTLNACLFGDIIWSMETEDTPWNESTYNLSPRDIVFRTWDDNDEASSNDNQNELYITTMPNVPTTPKCAGVDDNTDEGNDEGNDERNNDLLRFNQQNLDVINKYSRFLKDNVERIAPKKESLGINVDTLGNDLDAILPETKSITVNINGIVKPFKWRNKFYGATIKGKDDIKILSKLPKAEKKLLSLRLNFEQSGRNFIQELKEDQSHPRSSDVTNNFRKYLQNDGCCYVINGKQNIDIEWRHILERHLTFDDLDKIFKKTTTLGHYYFEPSQKYAPSEALAGQGVLCRDLVQIKEIKNKNTECRNTLIFVPGIGYHQLSKQEKARIKKATSLKELKIDWGTDSHPSLLWFIDDMTRNGIKLRNGAFKPVVIIT